MKGIKVNKYPDFSKMTTREIFWYNEGRKEGRKEAEEEWEK